MITTLASLAFAAVAAGAPDWENPAVNSRNRLPARTYTMPLASERAAFTDELEPDTPFRRSLNGIWKFSWAGNPDLRPLDFWKTDFDDSAWFTIDVPSCVETRGWGTPGYTNVRYPHKNKSFPGEEDFAKILDYGTGAHDYNPVASYRTTFTLPPEWSGREVILRFDGVYSAYTIWVNGEKAGYAEDSKLPSEFNITPYLRSEGPNLLAVEVFRWCDGSYLEDQDMNRFCGIFRDVTLWSMPKGGIWDFQVKTRLAADYASATLAVEGLPEGAEWKLYDGKTQVAAGKGAAEATVGTVKLWSAEKPNLYTLVVTAAGDIRSRKIGFKEQKIVGNTVLVNGRQIKFKGVNRHECSPDNGRTVTVAEMIADIELMKKYNINTVRTCHYPDHHSWYDLCDRYGIYIVAEANVEAHAPGYGDKGLGRIPEWEHTIVERNERNCIFQRNNPCVTFWSMGNETGHGDNFRKAIANVRRLDPTRMIHWERGNVDADVDSIMYPTVAWCEERGKQGNEKYDPEKATAGKYGTKDDRQTPGKAFFMCEYAHAMGNAIGDFEDYWDVFYRYDCMTGGCIWDWVDQALRKPDGRGGWFWAYGGDWDEEPNDGPFNCNGVVTPDRAVTAKLVEVGHVHRNLVVRRPKEGAGFELENRYGFTASDEFDGRWELVSDGVKVAGGEFKVPHVGPLSKGELKLPEVETAVAAAKDDKGELFVNFAFVTREAKPGVPKGWTVARDQLAVAREDAAAPRSYRKGAVAVAIRTMETDRTVTVTAGSTRAVFCRRSGTLCELVMNGKTILKDLPSCGVVPSYADTVAGPLLTFNRAYSDNDRWIREGGSWGWKGLSMYSAGLSQITYHARPIVVKDNQVHLEVEVTGSKSAGYTYASVWSFAEDGSITVENTATPHGTMPPVVPRLGLSLKLDTSLENLEYYGRGPRENYRDRKTASFVGLWRSTVSGQFEPYVRPQFNGGKSDVRWVEFTDRDGRGVRFAASEPMYLTALHYTWLDLEHARHRPGERQHRTPLVPRPEVCVDLDVRQTGLGGASCGPYTQDKYRFDPSVPVSWTLEMSAVSK